MCLSPSPTTNVHGPWQIAAIGLPASTNEMPLTRECVQKAENDFLTATTLAGKKSKPA
jgi:hypothetical protein